MADGRVSALALEAAQDQWAGFHVALTDVHQHLAGTAHGEDGQDLSWAAVGGEKPQGAAGNDQTPALETFARGQRRPSRYLGGAGARDFAAAYLPIRRRLRISART